MGSRVRQDVRHGVRHGLKHGGGERLGVNRVDVCLVLMLACAVVNHGSWSPVLRRSALSLFQMLHSFSTWMEEGGVCPSKPSMGIGCGSRVFYCAFVVSSSMVAVAWNGMMMMAA